MWLVFSATSILPAQDAADSAVVKSRALARTGNVAEAERILKAALAGGVDSPQVHGELGLLFYREGRFREAVPELGRAAQLDPDSAEYSLKLAASILGEHRYPVAVDFLQAIEPRFGALAEYRYNLGLAYYGTRDYTRAIEAFEKAIQIDPKMDLAFFFLGNAWAVSDELDKAVVNYRKALALNPMNAGYCLALGKILSQLGPDHDAEAIRWLRKALKLKPGDAASEFALALACERVGDLGCARNLAEDVAKRYPDEVSPAVLLARIYGKLHEVEKANAARATVKRLQRAGQPTPDAGRFPNAGAPQERSPDRR